ncbi:hypothetical protein IE53DRAFT_366962 [Violaceomyces palustris]|uniref:Uncharacterized protein n=1 Tax=Violaceomyces palustris TaxID=1673888 RepID=A0ACD0P3Q6_9BASI|nr:hypothetical protein IE53DRAFT_366962 [Violaceomyces palustris]
MAADQSTPSSSRINFRSSLPAPSSVARKSLLPKSMNQGPPSPSSPATQAKQSLAEAIANNDPARYRSDSASPTTSSQSSRLSAAAAAAAILPPKSNLAARKSLSGLKPRSETPTNPISRVQSHQLSPTTTSHTRRSSNNTSVDDSAGSPSSTSAATRQSSPGTGVDVSRAKSPLMVNRGGPSGISTPSRFQTPKRFSDVSMKTIPVPPIPGGTNYTTSTIASKARQMEPITSRRGRELEIGDHVRMEGTELTGVLRHLGPVQFKPGYYAGLELTGDSVGKGKNDGSVGG